MKKELTRRTFLKLAGAGALAVAMSGSLTGCDSISEIIESAQYDTKTLGDVKFMRYASSITDKGVAGLDFKIVSKSDKDMVIPLSGFTGTALGYTLKLDVDNTSPELLDKAKQNVVIPAKKTFEDCHIYYCADETVEKGEKKPAYAYITYGGSTVAFDLPVF